VPIHATARDRRPQPFVHQSDMPIRLPSQQ